MEDNVVPLKTFKMNKFKQKLQALLDPSNVIITSLKAGGCYHLFEDCPEIRDKSVVHETITSSQLDSINVWKQKPMTLCKRCENIRREKLMELKIEINEFLGTETIKGGWSGEEVGME